MVSGRRTLVLGATGKTGSRVLAGLRQRGERVRAGSRSGSPAFDWHDPSTWAAALRDIDTVYIASPITSVVRVGEDGKVAGFAAAEVSEFVTTAVRAGVERIVLLAGRSARDDSPYMVALEEPVRRSGVEWTILRPSAFMQNFLEEPVRTSIINGSVHQLASGDQPVDFIDVADIADVAVEVLVSPGHGGSTYELSGPRALTYAEAVSIIGRTLGRQITYSETDPERWARQARADGLTEDSIDFTLVAIRGRANGVYATPFDTVQRILRRPPRPFEAFVREAAATGHWTPTPGT